MKNKIILLISVYFLSIQAVSGAAYYVSTRGSDAGAFSAVSAAKAAKAPGSFKTAPFRTIGKVLEVVEPGDTIEIGGGVYKESITTKKAGAPGAPVIIQGR
ncbi:MAG: hypothetical protein V1752_03030, partial [Candidatus Firestonebacteria bacterium]